MLIKDLHPDVERYLKNDCYCPHEVYSFDGFFYNLFYEDQECEKIAENIQENGTGAVACVAHPFNKNENEPQVVLFSIEKNKVVDATRFDATENNIEIAKIFVEKGLLALKNSGRKFDEYVPGATAKSLKELLSFADAVIID